MEVNEKSLNSFLTKFFMNYVHNEQLNVHLLTCVHTSRPSVELIFFHIGGIFVCKTELSADYFCCW